MRAAGLILVLWACWAQSYAGEFALTGFLKNETAWRWQDPNDAIRSEWSLDLFASYTLNEQTSFHVQPRLYYDATWDYCDEDDPLSTSVCPHQDLRERYARPRRATTADPLREAYVDWDNGPLNLRLGKQQVAWGTADGIKLLDIINPSDLRELFQNTFEDFRVTLWMAKGEWEVDNEHSLQVVWVPDVKANQYPGLDVSGDEGHPFIFNGIDAITGPVNGFTHLSGHLGTIAGLFNQQFGQPDPSVFADQTVFNTGGLQPGGEFNLLLNQAISGLGLPTAAHEAALLSSGDGRINSLFEYIPNATFETSLNFTGLRSRYQREYPNSLTLEASNAGLRWKGKLGATQYSLNYYYHWGNNPDIDLSYEANGTAVQPVYARRPNATGTPLSITGFTDSAGRIYSGSPSHPSNQGQGDALELVFTERLHRVHSLGGSFDTQVDTRWGPFVLRGELVLDVDERQPIVDFGYFGSGDLAAGLRMEKADYVRYVIGVDKTLFQNLFASLQFIQFINLDHVAESSRALDSLGAPAIDPFTGLAYRRVTADFPTISLDNGFRAADMHKNFLSLYLATTFLNERVQASNLLLYSDDGGYWDQLMLRFDASDQISYFLESNVYFGSEDDIFGQFSGRASSLSLGIKYAF